MFLNRKIMIFTKCCLDNTKHPGEFLQKADATVYVDYILDCRKD